MARKNAALHLASLCVLCAGYLLCRYVFFAVHGMKQWPACLFLLGLVVLGISFFTKKKWTPLVTSFSYPIAFAIGALFQTDGTDPGGGRTNSLWAIWTVVFVCAIVLSATGETVKKNRDIK